MLKKISSILAVCCMLTAGLWQSLRAEGATPAFGTQVLLTTALICGDADGSGTVDLGDVTFLVNYLYGGGPAPDPEANGDQNCDGKINITDCTYLISYLFELGGAAPCCRTSVRYCPRDYTSSFDLETARQMSRLAHKAYSSSANFAPGSLVDSCWKAVKFIQSPAQFECDVVVSPGQEDTQLFIARDPWTGDLVVSFRGSVTLQDWISDAQFANPSDWVFDDGTVVANSVHKGFRCAYQSVKSSLKSELRVAAQSVADLSEARVYFTGHSLGGALATLAALDLSDWLVDSLGYDRNNVVMYSIAAPRPFKSNLLSQFRQRVPNGYAIMEKTDPVPYLLPTYTQINNLIEINSKLKSDGKVFKTRLEFINGEHLVDCGPADKLVPWSYGQAGHDHEYYVDRLECVVDPGLPSVSLGVKNGFMNLQWSGDVQGPCDRVVLCEDCPASFTEAELLLRVWQWVVNSSPEQTLIAKTEGLQAAYIDDYGRVINTSAPYVGKTPSKLTITRQPLGVVEVNWKVSDEGFYDYVALYKENPNGIPPTAYLPGTKHLVLPDSDDKHSWVRPVGPFWVAYVTAEAAVGGKRRVLRVAGPVN